MDQRILKLAHLLTHYSNQVKKGDKVFLNGPVAALPLLRAIYVECLSAGALATCEMDDPFFQEMLLKKGTRQQLAYVPEWKMREAELVDCLFRVQGETNTRALSEVDPQKQQMRMKGIKPLREILRKRMDDRTLRWCLTLFPTQAYAQDSDMSLTDFEDFVYSACKVHLDNPIAAWKKVEARQAKMAEFLNTARKVRIVAPGTDISFSVKGRQWINCCGTENMPDGEVFTGPVENTAEGKILFSFPACHNGREVEGVQLTFKEGRAVDAKALKNEAYLHKMMDLDEGAKYLGEFSFATNEDIQRFTRNILFDEKIGGTVHFALGASYAESGGVNKSVLHWDMICDLRKGGRAYVDGKLFLKDGKFLREF